MNEDEAQELTGLSDPLLASNMALDWVDLVLCTAGPSGLYMAATPKTPINVRRNIHYYRGQLQNLTCTSLAEQCASKIAKFHYEFSLISSLIWGT